MCTYCDFSQKLKVANKMFEACVEPEDGVFGPAISIYNDEKMDFLNEFSFIDKILINYCPICGKPIRDEKDFIK